MYILCAGSVFQCIGLRGYITVLEMLLPLRDSQYIHEGSSGNSVQQVELTAKG